MQNEAGYLVDMHGAIDMHLHPAPCLFPRLATDRVIAEAASMAGFGGLLFKCHHESTVSRAKAVSKDFPEMYIYGGITLNSYVGGINPKAVEAALKLGGKEVWLPSSDAAYHIKKHGGAGRYDVQVAAAGGDTRETGFLGISVIKDGELTPDAIEVFNLVAEHDVILGTCHQSYEELKIIISSGRRIGIKKILLTHPFFKVPGLSLDQVVELVSLGAIAEFGYCTVSPMWAYATIKQKTAAITTLGADNCIIMSDTGQRHNPMPPEALRIFAQALFESGIPETDLDILIRRNPARLLGLDPDELTTRNI